ncbi:hypothetical protein B0T22DRAFT_384088 [Podospora appendiculata]|uniref:CCHC-type domain-containing protein n=1 Tax=Podospora appendiculata TaxID=314037 RepID=A0AAE0X3P5_9PEZI|nr:hypothetical protein B0T22DRAFT_384088 [Podospora appendiculata]
MAPATSTPAPGHSLVLYNPQEFDVVMRDAADLAVTNDRIDNPPEWLVYLHDKIARTYSAMQSLAKDVRATQRQDLEELKRGYNQMRDHYLGMAHLYHSGTQVTQQQIATLHNQVEQASADFVQRVWSQIAKFATQDAARQQAVERLEEMAKFHQEALLTVQKEVQNQKNFQKEVDSWAQEKNLQIQDLLAREYLDPASLDSRMQSKLEELRQYTQAAIQEAQQQMRFSRPVDVDSVLAGLGRRAASTAPLGSQPSLPSVKFSSSEARMRDQLSSRNLQAAQSGRQASLGRDQFLSARTPMMSGAAGGFGGGFGGVPPLRPRMVPGGDPGDSDPDDDDDPAHLIELVARPTIAQVNPVHLNKPSTYSGKELSQFKPWWLKVESYIETYDTSFPTDRHRINWVGSLLTDKAQIWHNQRSQQVRRMGLQDHWMGYALAVQERFKDPAERHRNLRKMQELRYQGDTAQYITEMLDLNEEVQWSGTAFQTHISRTLPNKITDLVYSRLGRLPTNDEEFLDAIQEAGQIYENMMANPGFSSGKGAPASTPERSKSGQHPNPRSEGRSQSGQSSNKDSHSAGPPKLDPKDKRWSSNKEALKGISSADIDKRKAAKKACWRCGRDNHQTLACFARKDVDGKELPAAPEKTAAVKRKAEDPQPGASPAAKKAKIDAIRTAIPHPESVFEEIEDSDSDF